MPASFDKTLAYLQTRYLTLPQLADACGLAPTRLEALIAAGCLPAHSHEATLSLRVEAVINGSHPTQDKRVRYYHPDLSQLALEADALASRVGLESAAAEIRERQEAMVAKAASLEPGSAAHRTMADQVCTAWRDGTLGVCLQRVSVTDIVRKLLATERLRVMLEQAKSGGPNQVDERRLQDALDCYASVTGPFGPHERDKTTRALVYEPALALRAKLRGGVVTD
jgi:hypothetical protein